MYKITKILIAGLLILFSVNGYSQGTRIFTSKIIVSNDFVVVSNATIPNIKSTAVTLQAPPDAIIPDTYVIKTPSPATLYSHSVAVLSNKLYVFGGGAGSQTTNIYMFDGGIWTQLQGLPFAYHRGYACSFSNTIYLIAGRAAGGLAVTNCYTYNGATLTQIAGLPLTRQYHYGAVLNDKIYIIGGSYGGSYTTNVISFNGSAWSNEPPLPLVGTSDGQATVLSNKMYVCGGVGDQRAYCFNGSTWEVTNSPYADAFGYALATLGNYIYAFGGSSRTNTYKYDWTTWTEINGLFTNRSMAQIGVKSNVAYICGGKVNTTVTNIFETFTPSYIVPSTNSIQTFRDGNTNTVVEINSTQASFYKPLVISVSGSTPTAVKGGIYVDTNGVFYRCTNGTSWVTW